MTYLNASHTVLLRTEKKILRAQIALLSAIAKTHPEHTQHVSGLMRETAESLPPDLQPAAQTLMSPAEAAADKTRRTVSRGASNGQRHDSRESAATF